MYIYVYIYILSLWRGHEARAQLLRRVGPVDEAVHVGGTSVAPNIIIVDHNTNHSNRNSSNDNNNA